MFMGLWKNQIQLYQCQEVHNIIQEVRSIIEEVCSHGYFSNLDPDPGHGPQNLDPDPGTGPWTLDPDPEKPGP